MNIMMNQEIDCDDSYSKINTDMLFLIDKKRIIKYKLRKTPWYRIGIRIKLRNEINDLNKESDEIGERLERIHAEDKNPIKIVKRQ